MERREGEEVSRTVDLKGCSLDQPHQRHLGTCKKYRFSGLIPDLLNQKLEEWSLAVLWLILIDSG